MTGITLQNCEETLLYRFRILYRCDIANLVEVLVKATIKEGILKQKIKGAGWVTDSDSHQGEGKIKASSLICCLFWTSAESRSHSWPTQEDPAQQLDRNTPPSWSGWCKELPNYHPLNKIIKSSKICCSSRPSVTIFLGLAAGLLLFLSVHCYVIRLCSFKKWLP